MRHVVLRNFASNELLNIATASTPLISKSVTKITDSLKPATSDHRKVCTLLRNPHIHKLVNTYVLDKNLESERNIKILLVPVISNFQIKMALSTSSRASGVGGGGGESPSQSRSDHIDITYQQTRSPSTMTAHITDISQLSPTIKGFRYVSLARYVVHGHNL